MDATQALAFIRREEIGRGTRIATPFGERLICYADLTASGRALGFVERWISELLAYYANSHTQVSSTGKRMTDLREEARQIIRRHCRAAADDVVVFVGCGATAAVNKLVGLLGLDRPTSRGPRPLVLIGPYEHHSNVLPWLESAADVEEIAETASGEVDLADLEARLAAAGSRPLIVGSFSAASNVTGILSDVRAIARTLHRHGALAVFDFAACAPYAPIDLHPEGDPEAAMDAVFLSGHKFPGGPSSSGLLLANRRCFRRGAIPERPGGGTVSYVSHFDSFTVDYVDRLDEREEGGTPAVLGDIRAGLVFLVKELVGAEALLLHETATARRALDRLVRHGRIRLLGSETLPRLAILSFNIDGLHHDLAAVLLDHLFGVQNRAGCACAGPYGHRLLKVGAERSERFRAFIRKGVEGIKPGWVRVSIPPYASEADIEFILSAIEFVASRGEDFVSAYTLGWRDGIWRPRVAGPAAEVYARRPPPHLSLEGLVREPATASAPQGVEGLGEDALAAERAGYFRAATALADELRASAPAGPRPSTGDPALDELVWFRWQHAEGL